MKKLFIKKLIDDEGYSEHSATITAHDLLRVKDQEVKNAVIKWYETNEKDNIRKDQFSSFSLMKNYGMKYPSTLIFLDWYCESPNEAIISLQN